MSEIERNITLGNDLSELSRLADEVESFGEAAGLPLDGTFKLNLALDELATNVINHGGMASDGKIRVRLALEDEALIVEFEDEGQPFNPLEAEAPDTACGMQEREIGGLGIHLTKKCMDEMHYERRGRVNHLRMRRRIGDNALDSC
jgi:anti-sigma regulatory factor (Ser/Thr protein kinase)